MADVSIHRIVSLNARAHHYSIFSTLTIKVEQTNPDEALSVILFMDDHALARIVADAINDAVARALETIPTADNVSIASE